MRLRKFLLGFLGSTFRVLAATIIVTGTLLSMSPGDRGESNASGTPQVNKKLP